MNLATVKIFGLLLSSVFILRVFLSTLFRLNNTCLGTNQSHVNVHFILPLLKLLFFPSMLFLVLFSQGLLNFLAIWQLWTVPSRSVSATLSLWKKSLKWQKVRIQP